MFPGDIHAIAQFKNFPCNGEEILYNKVMVWSNAHWIWEENCAGKQISKKSDIFDAVNT